jgi:hypothetical protein
MAFDPDAYLGATSAPASSGGFDPDEYLKKKTAPPSEQTWAGRAASFLGAPSPEQPDPYGANATIGRVATGIVGGIPDLAIKVQNAHLNPFDMVGAGVDKLLGTGNPDPPRIPEITPLLRQATGTPELPQDASTTRRFLEGAATVAASGGARAVGSAIQAAPTATAAIMPAVAATGRNIVAPVVGSEVLGNVGEKIGGEQGGVIGSVVGGLAGSAPSPRTLVERYYGAHGRPDAPDIAARAAAENIPTTAGMLGNERIQDLEKAISGKGTAFLSNPVVDARERTLVALRERADQAAADRGATHPMPTPGTIGERVLDTADQTAQALKQRSSDVQQGMYDRIGNAPVNVAPTYAALRSEIASTDPISARPMVQRLDALEQMMPRDKFGQVVLSPSGEIHVPIDAFKDWTGGLGRQTQTLEAVPGRHLDKIYGPARDAMRETAVSEGVQPHEFDMTQGVTRSLTGSGGPVKYFEKIAGKQGTSGEQVGAMPPERAFNRVVDEQNPEGLRRLEQHADPAALGQIAGDTLRLRAQETLGQGGTGGSGAPIEGVRGGGAAGARRFTNWWNSMSPEAQRVLGGNQQGTMQNLSELSGAFNYPTRQQGLSRAMGAQLGGLGGKFAVANAAGEVAKAIGLPRSVGWGAGYFGLSPAINYLHGKLLESETARRGMARDYSTTATPTIADLLAQLTAAGNAHRRPQQ